MARERPCYADLVRFPNRGSVTHLTAFVLGALVAGATSVVTSSHAQSNRARYAALDTFAQALSAITQRYVDPVDESQLIYGAIGGMTSKLDNYSIFYNPDQFRRLREDTGGEYSGVGITSLVPGFVSGMTPYHPRIDTVLPGSPAARAGIREGDLLVSVDGKWTAGKDAERRGEEWLSALRGVAGSRVQVQIQRPTWAAPRSFALTRERLKLPTVESFSVEPRIGYISISKFQEATTRDVEKALSALRKNGTQALILDLRNNPGGLVDQAVTTADLFLKRGTIVSIRGRIGTEVERHKARRTNTWPDMRMLILVDQNTASAAEIVAGALQDHKRATLLGLPSYGKGSVQTFFDMDDGSGLKLTTAYYMTPNNRSLDKHGITPDIKVEMFAPEIIEAGRPVANSDQSPTDGGAPEGADDSADQNAAQSHWPARLRGDHQFEVAYQTARSWLGSKSAMTGQDGTGASR